MQCRLKKLGFSLMLIFFLSLATKPAEASNEPWKTPPIPSGWTYLTGTWDKGYVIKDFYGNEFVWIPVGAVNAPGGVAALKEYDWGKGRSAPSQVHYEPIPSQITNAINITGGFYIARYEASRYNNKAESRPNRDPWDQINWEDARTKAEGAKANWGWTDVYSHLPYDKEWDVIVKWLENSGANVTDSTDWGNYGISNGDGLIGSRCKTGSSPSFQKNNIFDLAGNLYEWTMDCSSDDSRYCLARGGSYNNYGSSAPVSVRIRNYIYSSDSQDYRYIGFRTAFVVLVNRPPAVALVEPIEGISVSQGSQVDLSWNATDPDGDSISAYNLRIGVAPGDNSLATYNGANTSFSFNTSSLVGPYPKTVYWAVQAQDDKGLWSPWAERSFTVVNVAPVIQLNTITDSYSEITDHNRLVISGQASDADNDDVTVYVKISNSATGAALFSDNKVVAKCSAGKPFSFDFTFDNSVPEGAYTVDVWANDGKN